MDNTNQQSPSPQETPEQQQPVSSNFSPRSKIPMIAIGIVLLVIVAFGAYLLGAKKNSTIDKSLSNASTQQKEVTKNKSVIVLHTSITTNPLSKIVSTTTIYAFNPVSKEKKEVLKFTGNTTVNEAKVSPDGLKLFYTATNSFEFSNKVAVADSSGAKKEYSFAESNLWTLSSPGVLKGGSKNDCYWSPDSTQLACMLIERESPSGAGTGKAKLTILNYASGEVRDVFTSDLIAQPQRAIVPTHFVGWIGNDKLLVIQTKHSIASADILPADFYSVDINSKQLQKKFSYQYDPGFDLIISQDGNQVFFDSFSRVNEDKFIKYDIATNKDTVLASSKDVLNVRNPTISEDGSKLIYVLNSTNIHIYDLATGQEQLMTAPFPIFFVDSLLPSNKEFVVRKTPETSFLFNGEAQNTEDLGGVFIGLGYF